MRSQENPMLQYFTDNQESRRLNQILQFLVIKLEEPIIIILGNTTSMYSVFATHAV